MMIDPEDHDRIVAAKDAQIEALEARPRVCVVGLITDPADRVLLIKHRKRGTWELPGGKHDRGETWRNALRREMKEETGLDVNISTQEPTVLDGVPVGGAGYHSVILVAHCRAESEPAPGDDAEDARWFTRDEIPWGDLSKIGSAEVVKRWVEQQDEAEIRRHNERSSPVWHALGEIAAALGCAKDASLNDVIDAAQRAVSPEVIRRASHEVNVRADIMFATIGRIQREQCVPYPSNLAVVGRPRIGDPTVRRPR